MASYGPQIVANSFCPTKFREASMTATVEKAPTTGTRTAWKLDPAHTTVEFSAKHLMISTVKGRITDIEGTIYTDETNPRNSSVEATLKAASLDTRTDQRDQHLGVVACDRARGRKPGMSRSIIRRFCSRLALRSISAGTI